MKTAFPQTNQNPDDLTSTSQNQTSDGVMDVTFPEQTLSERLAIPTKKKRGVRTRYALFSLLVFAIMLYPNFRLGKVSGISMMPKFKSGDSVIVLKSYRWVSPLKVGDIVIAKPDGEDFDGEDVIKRVVFIQNKEANAPWPKYIVNSQGSTRSMSLFPMLVMGREVAKPGDIYLLGDNMDHSMDSRDFGPVQDKDIVGKVISF